MRRFWTLNHLHSAADGISICFLCHSIKKDDRHLAYVPSTETQGLTCRGKLSWHSLVCTLYMAVCWHTQDRIKCYIPVWIIPLIFFVHSIWYFQLAACLALLIMITFVCACNIGTWIIFLGWLVFAGDWYVVSTYLNYMYQLISTPLLKLHVPDWQGEEAFILLTFSKMTHLASWALLIRVCWLILISLCHAPRKKDAMPKVREHLV